MIHQKDGGQVHQRDGGQVGKTISHYNILEKLGEGGMGIVYKAFDTKLERDVALKLLRPEAMGDPAAKERFIREARAASALNHPNITTIHEIDEWHGQDFICMEYVEGETVKKKIQSGQMPMDEVLNIATQTVEALQEAHEHDITHRDIKSENIMVTPKGQIKVMDFGLAKLKGVGGLTKNGTTMGTISYMSPEQARGEDVDHRTDIWSFGVVLYEMITGQLPFKGEYEQAVIYSIMNEEPKRITELRSSVSLELERIVGKCLEKQTEDRYQTSENLLADLNKLQKDIITGKSRTIKSAAAIPAKQKKKRTAIFAFAAVLVLAIVSYFVYQFTSKEIEVEDKTVAIMYIEDQTGDEAYHQQANIIIPQIYQKLFINHKDIILPSIEARNQIEAIQKAATINKKTALKILNDARIKYRVTALIQKTGDDLNYILETTKPGKHPLVWQETLTKSDSAISEEFAQAVADWIEACVWVDEFEKRIHKEYNFPKNITSRDVLKNQLSKNIFATKAYYQGLYLLQASNFSDAIPYLKEARRIEPEYHIATALCALALAVEGQQQTALNVFEQLKERSINFTHYEQLCFQDWHETMFGERELAIKALRELSKYETYPEFWFHELGILYYVIGDYENASDILEKHIKSGIFPTWNYGYSFLQSSYNNLGLWEKALRPLKIGLKRNPKSRELMIRIIEQYLLLGNTKKADKWFMEYEKVSRIEVESIFPGYHIYGKHFLIMGDFEKADEYYQKALAEKNITDSEINSIAYDNIYMGKYEKAETILLDAVERFPDNIHLYNNLSFLYRSKKDYIKMLQYANKAYDLALSNTTASRYYHIARALSFTANNDSAQAHAEWSYLIDEYSSDNWIMGYIYSLKGDVELAMENLETAFEKGSRNIISYCYDPDKENVRNDPRTKDRYTKLLEKIKATYPALGKKKK